MILRVSLQSDRRAKSSTSFEDRLNHGRCNTVLMIILLHVSDGIEDARFALVSKPPAKISASSFLVDETYGMVVGYNASIAYVRPATLRTERLIRFRGSVGTAVMEAEAEAGARVWTGAWTEPWIGNWTGAWIEAWVEAWVEAWAGAWRGPRVGTGTGAGAGEDEPAPTVAAIPAIAARWAAVRTGSGLGIGSPLRGLGGGIPAGRG